MSSTQQKKPVTAILLCALVAVAEGFDLQAPGLAAQKIIMHFDLSNLQMGWIFTIGLLAMLPAAIVGGRLADRYGRRNILAISVAVFSVFSILTAYCDNYVELLAVRFFTGLGLGAALPNIVAMSSDAVGPKRKGAAVSVMYCGVPVGAVLGAALGVGEFSDSWTFLFYVGGIAPLLLVPFLFLLLPNDTRTATEAKASSTPVSMLFKDARWIDTLLLWSAFFFTMLVAYVLINWMPSLLIAQGLTPKEMNYVVMVMHTGSILGTLLLGYLLDRAPLWAIPTTVYSGILVALTGLYFAGSLPEIFAASFIAGMFTVGGQGVLFALAPLFFPHGIRVTGVSSCITVGRVGAMSGPVIMGKFLSVSGGTAGVMLACSPVIIVAAASLLYLSRRHYRASEI